MFRIRELFQACMFYCYISNVCVFSKRLLLLLTYVRIYTKRGGDVARLRGGEKAERSEESALFKLLSLFLFCFLLSRVLLLSFASLAQEEYDSLRTPSLLGRADSTELIKTVFSP